MGGAVAGVVVDGAKPEGVAKGALFGIDWLLGLATGTTWAIVAFFFRYSSLASIVWKAAFRPLPKS